MISKLSAERKVNRYCEHDVVWKWAPVAVVFFILSIMVQLANSADLPVPTSITGGEGHGVALKSDGSVWTWGDNSYGQLGDGTLTNKPYPFAITSMTNAVFVAAGDYHTISLKADGTIWTWGFGGYGQLGTGGYTNSSVPVKIATLNGIVAAGGGSDHAVALKNDGTVWTWGTNNFGQLGNGSLANSPSPVQVGGMTGAAAVSTMWDHTLCLKSNGTVWAWGDNFYGQVGNGTTTSPVTNAVQLSLTNIIRVAAGGQFSLALKSDGTVWAWGRNKYGQLGNLTTNNVSSPGQIPGISNIVEIAAGARHGAALKSDGSVWTWGYDEDGELGDHGWLNSLGASRVPGMREIIKVSCSRWTTTLLRRDSTVWEFGWDHYGNLGDECSFSRATPVPLEQLTICAPGQANPVARSTRFQRGQGTEESFYSFVLPLNGQKGVKLHPLGANSDVLFKTNMWTRALSHLNYFTNQDSPRMTVYNPLAAFGSRVGGSALYYGQSYSFGAYAGDPSASLNDGIAIEVYDKTTFNYVSTHYVPIPSPAQQTEWTRFVTNGFTTSTNAYGLTTTVRFSDPYNQLGPDTNASYVLSHVASPTNYFYLVQLKGKVDGANLVESFGTNWWSRLYTLEFETRPPWRSKFVDQPHFEGMPMPPTYQGKTVDELLNLHVAVTNSVSLAPSACKTLDQSPELRRHPILDQFVSDMGKDPIALANYVINEIRLTDTISLNDSADVGEQSINLGGVSRGALATFLEEQGSPVEQCALLVYLLRQADVPAVYIYPPHNGLKLLDRRVSSLLRVQIKGLVNDFGESSVPELIPVNYPWVAAYVPTGPGVTNWVHMFPWLKDTEIVEGLDLYKYMPSNYNNGLKWLKSYLMGDTNIMSADAELNAPAALFPKFIESSLLANFPGISLNDIGTGITDRRHYYYRWSDFPTPTWLTNISTSIESLGSSSITNVAPSMTNIFDTFSVDISSQANPSVKISTGPMRVVDVHNRRLLIYHEKISSTQHRMILSLAPFRPDATNRIPLSSVDLMGADTNVIKNLTITNTLNASDDVLNITWNNRRHRALDPTVPDDISNWDAFLGVDDYVTVTDTTTLRKGDLAAICLDFGRVSERMINVHAQEFWNMQRTLRLTPSATNSLSVEVYQGIPAFLMGLTYYSLCDKFQELNDRLHKVNVVTYNSMGIAGLKAKRDGTGALINGGDIILNSPYLDIFGQDIVHIGNATLRPDAGEDFERSQQDWAYIFNAETSAEEHRALNLFYGESNAVSSVKMLQIAQANTNQGGPGLLMLNINNYQTYGNTHYDNNIALKNIDPGVWQALTGYFDYQYNSNYVLAFMTPGSVANNSGTYRGVAFLQTDGRGLGAAVIGGNLNGGYGSQLPDSFYSLLNAPNLDLRQRPDGSFYIVNAPGASSKSIAPDLIRLSDALRYISDARNDYTPVTDVELKMISQVIGALNMANAGADGLNWGNTIDKFTANGVIPPEGNPRSLWQMAADPVNIITGEFYIDSVDLTLPGPMPLQIRRNYSSRNLAPNQFGYGWKLNYMPYLSLSVDTNLIYAAEPDGLVVVYSRVGTNDLWIPTRPNNPQLNNHSRAGIGSEANMFNSYIQRTNSGPNTFYKLQGSDGGLRTFQVMTFQDTFTNTRPYLTIWKDNRGNSYSFEYGTDPTKPDFGQARRIKSSNGGFLVFDFDPYGRIVNAYTGDGRRIEYEYDQFNDLIGVVLPDSSKIGFEYQHAAMSVTNSGVVTVQSYSTHLITREIKPDGRVLVNSFDAQRRVTNQLSTVGADLNPIRNATFLYTNNFGYTNAFTNTVSGTTWVKDVFNNATIYSYTNDLITTITDPLGQSIVQDWYDLSESNKVGYYQQSLEKLTDKRGLITSYQYDTNGNATNIIVTGDIVGDGNISATATNVCFYDTNNLLITQIDASGRTNKTFYTNGWLISRTESYPLNSSISQGLTNAFFYSNVTNATDTNLASFGLVTLAIRAINSSDAASNSWAYDYRGFVTNTTRYTGGADPNVSVAFVYNNRNELVEQTDALGRRTTFDYDPLSRPRTKEVYEAGQSSPLAWDYSYYNDNGELIWSDGPRYDPEDYVWRDYDGSGRKTQEIRWRSRARADGTGIESEVGDGLYATTFFYYDAFGNLTNVTDPKGNYTFSRYDSLGQLTNEIACAAAGTPLRTNQFQYEAGGLVTTNISPSGGITRTLYTSTGKPSFRSLPDGTTNAWRYYRDGRPQKEILSNGSYWETIYDDANRKVARIFKSSSGSVMATTTNVFDRRGNLINHIDEEGYLFTTAFDGLDRVRVSAGPPAGMFSAQQISTNQYDSAGQSMTNINALGEKVITTSDSLGRPISVIVFSSGGMPVRQTSTIYAPNHNSVTVTEGTGSDAISTTTYTDTFGKSVLILRSPAAGITQAIVRTYDILGNLVTNRDELGQFTSYGYDGLNRQTFEVLPDGATVTFAYNASGSLTNRTMPGGLTWTAGFDSANRKTNETLTGNAVSRNTIYLYYTNGANIGLLKDTIDARGITNELTYDGMFRIDSVLADGSAPDDGVLKQLYYDKRGLLTQVLHQMETGQGVQSSLYYDGYKQIYVDASWYNSAWARDVDCYYDAAGRRTRLCVGVNVPGQGLGSGTNTTFAYRADGLLSSVINAGVTHSFSYADNGLLTNRSNPFRNQIISQRDGLGHVRQITNMVGATASLVETLNWRANSTIDDYTATKYGNPAELRDYIYNPRGQLTNETFATASNGKVTNQYSFDSSKLGVLTTARQSGALGNRWESGPLDGFMRVQYETNAVSRISVRATGNALGAASVTGVLDGSAVNPINFSPTSTDGRWYADLDLWAGSHTLIATAHHPFGAYHPNATNNFSAAGTNTTSNSYDANGNLTNRVYASGRSQALRWNGENRLISVTEQMGGTNVYTWTALYDGLGRRFRTTATFTSGTNLVTETIDSWYDPRCEFLEIAAAVNGERTWKVYGPDVTGRYGGAQGIGGLEAAVKERDGTTTGFINDYYGNAVATVSGNTVTWSGTKLTAYGPAQGYRAPVLSSSTPVSEAALWQDRMIDITGFYYFGARYYDPLAGRFISTDPKGHVASMDLYSYALGDPVNNFDPDGRLGKKAGQYSWNAVIGFGEVWTGHQAVGDAPPNVASYYGRVGGRNAAGALAAFLAIKGGGDMAVGGTLMVGSVAVEVGSGGTLTIIAGPGFAAGAIETGIGAVETGLGAWGLYNFNKLDPVERPQSEGPRGGLHPDAGPYKDPGPTQYEGGFDPADPVKDHLTPRAAGGDPKGPIDIKSRESNAIKGGREGQLLQYEQYLREHGMSEADIKKVTGPEWDSNRNDVHARATDPVKFDKMMGPP